MQVKSEHDKDQEESFTEVKDYISLSPKKLGQELKLLEQQMLDYASDLNFEEAAKIRDKIKKIEQNM